jgi:hypothetical protein
MLPWLKVIADEHGVETDLLRGAGEIQKLFGPELLGRSLVP